MRSNEILSTRLYNKGEAIGIHQMVTSMIREYRSNASNAELQMRKGGHNAHYSLDTVIFTRIIWSNLWFYYTTI